MKVATCWKFGCTWSSCWGRSKSGGVFFASSSSVWSEWTCNIPTLLTNQSPHSLGNEHVRISPWLLVVCLFLNTTDVVTFTPNDFFCRSGNSWIPPFCLYFDFFYINTPLPSLIWCDKSFFSNGNYWLVPLFSPWSLGSCQFHTSFFTNWSWWYQNGRYLVHPEWDKIDIPIWNPPLTSSSRFYLDSPHLSPPSWLACFLLGHSALLLLLHGNRWPWRICQTLFWYLLLMTFLCWKNV